MQNEVMNPNRNVHVCLYIGIQIYRFFDTVAHTLGTCSELGTKPPKTYFRTWLFVLSTLQYSQPCMETYMSTYQYTPCLQLGHAARADLYGLLIVKF